MGSCGGIVIKDVQAVTCCDDSSGRGNGMDDMCVVAHLIWSWAL
jgi:hypothetical protein